jgi:hypothetical protein
VERFSMAHVLDAFHRQLMEVVPAHNRNNGLGSSQYRAASV